MSLIPMHYQTAYQWSGEAEAGRLSIEGHADLDVGSPRQPERLSPEHMLVAAAETCLANYILLFAEMSDLEITAYSSTAEGELVQEGAAEFRFDRIVIQPRLTVDEARRDQAGRIVDKAHKACLVARSLACTVEVKPQING